MWPPKFNDQEKKWYSSVFPHLYHENATIGYIAITELAKFPDCIVQINGNTGVQVTAKEMRSKIIRAAVHFEHLKLKQDDVVGVIARNNDNLAPIIFGALLHGLTINAIDVLWSQVILCDSDQHEKVFNVIRASNHKSTVIVTFDKRTIGCDFIDDYFVATPKEMFYVPISLKDGTKQTAFMALGTTTRPYKAVCVSHAHYIKKTFLSPVPISIKTFCPSSPGWFIGIDHILSTVLSTATNVISPDALITVENFFRIIETYKVDTVTILSNSLFAQIMKSPMLEKADLSSLQAVGLNTTSTALQLECEEFQNHLPNGQLIHAYCMAEQCGVCSLNLIRGKFDTVGFLHFDLECRIVDATTGQLLGPNQSGNIVMRDVNYKLLVYKSDSEGTHEINDDNTEGWIDSGDIGYFDDYGLLYITHWNNDRLNYSV